jgi:UDP-2,3-diacylglucosamine hydrolase
MERYGLIAGNGKFPFLVLEAARSQNIDLVVMAIKEEAAPEIVHQARTVHWIGLGQLGRLIKIFHAEGVTRAMMAGQVKHKQIFSSIIPDLTLLKLLANLKSRNTNSLIGAVAKVLEEEGIELLDSTLFLKPLLPDPGLLTRRAPTEEERKDIEYGHRVAREISRLDLGQTIAVRKQACIAIEAMEGTDAVIRRAAEIAAHQPTTIVKVSMPHQDMRFDVPVIGIPTIQLMAEMNATALAIDAHKTLMLDRAALIELANQKDISISAYLPGE